MVYTTYGIQPCLCVSIGIPVDGNSCGSQHSALFWDHLSLDRRGVHLDPNLSRMSAEFHNDPLQTLPRCALFAHTRANLEDSS